MREVVKLWDGKLNHQLQPAIKLNLTHHFVMPLTLDIIMQ